MSDLREAMQRGRREAPSGDEAFARLLVRRDRRRRNGRIMSAAVALAVTGAMVAGGLAVLNHRGNGEGPAPGEGSSTGQSSQVPQSGPANAGVDLVAAPGEFYYWKFVYVMKDGHADLAEWYGTDGSGRVEASTTTDGFGVPPNSTWASGDSPFGGEDLSGLSTDPAVLRQQLLQRGSEGGASPQPNVTPGPGQDRDTGGLVRAITDLLGYAAPNASPQLRAALYDVFRGLPTAEDLGSVSDPAGRPAVAVRITTEGSTQTLYFDPATHLFMAESWGGGDSSLTTLIVQAGGISESRSDVPSADRMFFPEAEHLPAKG